MKPKVVHCLFEQSGTFKNEFKKLGYDAYDYDIQNEFGETDYVVDLFSEIRGGYCGEPSIFDKIGKDDLVMAFFPCVRFEQQILLWFRGESLQQQNMDDVQKLEKDIELHNELNELYELLSKLMIICIKKQVPIILENPYSEQHYLRKYWCLKANVIDNDRRKRGDYYKKPTQYWFIGCKPENNFIFEPIEFVEPLQINKLWGTNKEDVITRSLIHPQYANRFIREQILDELP